MFSPYSIFLQHIKWKWRLLATKQELCEELWKQAFSLSVLIIEQNHTISIFHSTI